MKVHFLGIGGAGCSALASWMWAKGYQVEGCDLTVNERVQRLINQGIPVIQGNSPNHIKDNLDWFIFPNIAQSHPEITQAKKQGIKTSTYFEALGEITKNYTTIAIAGAHGKTTTTLMIKTVLEKNGKDPNAIVGEGIYRAGKSRLFVVEACEYKKQFLSLKPDYLVITNIAYDHPDCYRSQKETAAAFLQLVSQMKQGSFVLGYEADHLVNKILHQAKKQGKSVRGYGEEIKQFRPQGWGSKSIIQINQSKLKLKLALPGKHNVLNALAALKLALALGIKLQKASKALADFTGCPRRLEKIGQINQAILINDYAHHPDQIRAVIQALKEAYPKRRLIVVFEPHQYERLWRLFPQFINCWSGVDQLFLLPIYYVKGRESKKATQAISDQKLKQAIAAQGIKVKLFNNYQSLWRQLQEESRASDLIAILSAGPINSWIRKQIKI